MDSGAEYPRLPDLSRYRPDAAAQVEQIRTNLDRYGEAFLAYLMLDGVDQSAPDLGRTFLETYAGWYPNRKSFLDGQLESLGWTDALEAFKTANDLWPHELQFDLDRIWAHCIETYNVEERLGGVHAFFK